METCCSADSVFTRLQNRCLMVVISIVAQQSNEEAVLYSVMKFKWFSSFGGNTSIRIRGVGVVCPSVEWPELKVSFNPQYYSRVSVDSGFAMRTVIFCVASTQYLKKGWWKRVCHCNKWKLVQDLRVPEGDMRTLQYVIVDGLFQQPLNVRHLRPKIRRCGIATIRRYTIRKPACNL